ncbi:MAG: hypothetical protein ACJ795_00765 [Ktedonobacteraceae bacterium]
MNCNSCGANLPPGTAFCTLCGAPTPYNAQPSSSSPQFDPTVMAPQPGSPGNSPQIDPTMLASPSSPYGSPDAPPPPSTGYGAPSYGAPSYGAPPPPVSPYQPNQYNAGAPPVGGYGQPGTYGAFQQPPKPRSKLGLILAIIGGVLLLICIGTCAVVYQASKSGVSTINTLATTTSATETAAISTVTAVTSDLTPTTGSNQTTAPSGQSVDATAASIITNPQMSSAVDSNYKPTKVSSSFTTGQTIYATFTISDSSPAGYILGKWYSDGTYAFSSDILKSSAGGGAGYLAARYNKTTQGAVEIYWCSQKDCSDAKLADVINFSVSSTGLHWTVPPVVTNRDINRPE